MPWEPWERELLEELTQRKICRCGQPKKLKQTFCRGYFSLPRTIRQALYRYFDAGYQEARIAAGHFLGEARFLRFDVPEEFREVLGCE